MKELTWTADETGMVSGSYTHDGTLSKLILVNSGQLDLEIKCVSGKSVLARLSGITYLNVKELWESSILLGFFVCKISDIPDGEYKSGFWHSLFVGRESDSNMERTAHEIKKKTPDSLLVEVECSYGGSIAVVCASLCFFEV